MDRTDPRNAADGPAVPSPAAASNKVAPNKVAPGQVAPGHGVAPEDENFEHQIRRFVAEREARRAARPGLYR